MNKLIEILESGQRLSNEQIAAMLQITPEEVADSIDKLYDEGIIRGSKLIIDFEKCDSERITALIELKVTPKIGAGFEDVAAEIMSIPEVESVYLMSGGYDLMVLISGKTFKQVALFVAKRLATLDSVTSTATHFVLRKYKELGVTIVGPREDDRGSVSF